MEVRSHSLRTRAPPGANVARMAVEHLLSERDRNMMQHVAEHDKVILSGLAAAIFWTLHRINRTLSRDPSNRRPRRGVMSMAVILAKG